MKYREIVQGEFVNRINRFCGEVKINGEKEVVHIKNTGRCKELLIEGAKVFLEPSNNPNRKTKYSLIAVYKNDLLINMDSQVPNQVVAEALEKGYIKEVGNVDFIKREVTFQSSRFDIYFESGERKGFIEVKGVTLEENGLCKFPDAPTTRGTKHINELIEARKQGFETYIFFLIQMENITKFEPYKERDPNFAKAIENAIKSEVKVLVYNSKVSENSIELDKSVAF